ncbi:DNA mismatch repair protein MutS [Zancudomyces culisetae]|uniref:DNA mismatch repair protein MutS n=1 Tax=Zancudomyces culisetae TaxID=1213189 RepID=A0A1R1PKU0_ZANCU|nr:DNA mismatch repair protein MutS [Zancudomyces culisetae]|eukprot:OMH81576.1 DNA mismatch repair protein MutS [Zancudomyces culisetae]
MALLLAQLDLLHEQIQLEEQNVFNMLKILVLESHNQIKSNCSTLSVLDVSCCLAKVAVERGYTRPTFNINGKSSDDMVLPDKNYDHSIISGRHPVVELRLSENGIQFVPNDCVFDSNCHITLLTGPNMGGKSTYLRQVALISVMAQMGSFVPAENAALKIVDSIYTRIGAHDNLALNQSTFMVEMLETADILKHATSNSLVIMDEVGRGTSTADGMAIAYATLAYLHENIKPLCLFATHYHEIVSKFFSHRLPFSFDHNSFYLNSSLSPSSSSSTPSSSSPTISSSTTTSSPLPISFDKLKLMHTAIQDQIDPTSNSLHFTFIHKVLPGICTNSHGLYVAALAGVPNSVIKNAESFITTYRSSII